MAIAQKNAGGLATTGGYAPCPIFPGDAVEIFGLTSASGRELNGCHGVATKKIRETGRFEVRVGVDRRVDLKPENLRLVSENSGKVVDNLGFAAADKEAECALAATFRPGDLVEAMDLSSLQGRDVNGKTGTVVADPETPPDRVKVRFELPLGIKHVTVKPVNLRKLNMGGLSDAARESKGMLKDNKQTGSSPSSKTSAKSSDSQLFTRVDLAVETDEASACAVKCVAPDGVAYTKEEFLQFYGGTKEWDEAPVVKEEANPSLHVGDVVEISGLTSEAGQLLNGNNGVVLKLLTAEGRAEVRLADGHKKMKFENLRKQDLDAGDRYSVEVFGLQSESGQAMNGQRGIATSKNPKTGRIEVALTKDKKVSLKPENLKLLNRIRAES